MSARNTKRTNRMRELSICIEWNYGSISVVDVTTIPAQCGFLVTVRECYRNFKGYLTTSKRLIALIKRDRAAIPVDYFIHFYTEHTIF